MLLQYIKNNKMIPTCYGHLGANHECPDYQGALIFQVCYYDNKNIISINQMCGLCINQMCGLCINQVDYAGLLINRFYYCIINILQFISISVHIPGVWLFLVVQ